jgi:hypothetical protein
MDLKGWVWKGSSTSLSGFSGMELKGWLWRVSSTSLWGSSTSLWGSFE